MDLMCMAWHDKLEAVDYENKKLLDITRADLVL